MTKLDRLPARIDALTSQVSQLRTGMRDEFSAVRSEMRDMRDELNGKIDGKIDSVAVQMHVLHGEALTKLAEQGVQMRVLHEDVISRIGMLSEGSSSRGSSGRKKKR